MTPEMSASVTAQIIAQIVMYLGKTPILLFLIVIVIGPWATTVLLEWKRDKRNAKIFARQDKRFEEVVEMYERNVELVKNYERITENLQDLVILTTSTMTTLVDHIKGVRSKEG